MAKVGYKTYVGFGQEATFGTAVAPVKYVEYNSEGFKVEIEELLNDAINGTPQYKKRLRGNKTITGSVEFPLVPGSELIFLDSAFSLLSRTTLTTGVYKYVFGGRSSVMDTGSQLTFQVCRDTADTLSTFNYTGCKVGDISFNCAVNETLKCSVNVTGKDEVAANTISTAAYRTYNPYYFKGATVSIANSISVTTVACIDSWSVNVTNNLLTDRCLDGSTTVSLIEGGMQDITYDMSGRYIDNGNYNRFLNGTPTYIKADFDTGVTIASTYTHKITFESYNAYFNGSTPNVGSAGDLIKQSINARAIFDTASTSSILISVITELASITA